MLTVHHLNDSRSHRILWLLEELGVAYELKHYRRLPETRWAPPELKAVVPLGKSPAITDQGRNIGESGAIVDYIIRRHGGGRLQPDPATPAYDEYMEWLHYAEGSAMFPVVMNLYLSRLNGGGAAVQPRVDSELANHLGHFDQAVQGRQFIVGDSLTGADIMMSYVAELTHKSASLKPYPNIITWIKAMQARPAYKAAIARGGPYHYAVE